MLRKTFLVALLMLFIAAGTLVALLPVPEKQTSTAVSDYTLAITNVRVFDGEAFVERTSLFVRDGLIAAIAPDVELPENTTIIDGNGKTVLPGFIDAHTHTYGDALETSLRFGVTANLDMFTSVTFLAGQKTRRDAVARTEKADLFSAGMLATVAGGHGTQFGVPIETLSNPADVPAWVARRKAEGSDYIKLVYIPGQTRIPSLDRATAAAVIQAAHAEGLLAIAHISTLQAATDLLQDDVDGLVHLFADAPVTPEFATLAAADGVFITPTLSILASVTGQSAGGELADDQRISPNLNDAQIQSLKNEIGGSWPGFDFDLALQNTRMLHEAGVQILAGTDAPNPGTVHGASLHQELELLVRAGLSPADALGAATAMPAKAFGLQQRGVIKVGARADLLIVDGNPATDITATRNISAIIKNGFLVDRGTSAETAAVPVTTPELGLFENGMAAPDGLAWNATDDGIMGGQSSALLSIVESGAGDSAAALHVSAEVRGGFFDPWAGAFIGSGEGSTGVHSLAAFTQLSFAIRGKPATYRVMMIQEGAVGAPPTQDFQVTGSWQTITLDFADFPGFSPETVIGIAIVAGPASGDYEYDLDEVRLIRK